MNLVLDIKLKSRIQSYRLDTYQVARISTLDAAIEFVNQRGFVFFWPIKEVEYPSLWAAVAGNRPVPDEHDDPGHITWRWKDAMLGKDAWYYAKIIRQKSTMISFPLAPCFYALSDNYGDIESDHITLYEQGRMTQEAKSIYEAILNNGPLDTIALKKAAHLSSPSNEYRFNRALSMLQSEFKLLPIGISEVGSWKYAFIYEIPARYYPALIEKSRFIDELIARSEILNQYFLSMGVADLRDLNKMFRWTNADTHQALDQLLSTQLIRQIELPDSSSPATYGLTSIF